VQFIKEDVLKDVLQINTIVPVMLTQRLTKQKKIKKGGSIVFTSSISGFFNASVGNSIYSISKGAISSFMKNAALDLAPKGIRCNTVNPGMIQTKMISGGVISDEQLQEDMKRYPLKRFGEPEEVAFAIIYLLSDASQWVTGTSLVIDGGRILH
jgi:NAD(P)-dependent dehydrogenase (short-subunit alcohol dehydrogenase family)